MIEIVLVYRTKAGKAFLGFFDEDGDITEFREFDHEAQLDSLELDKFGICEFHHTGGDSFKIDMIAQIQVMLNPEHAEVGENLDCTAEEFIDDPKREPDSFKVMYQGILQQMAQEATIVH